MWGGYSSMLLFGSWSLDYAVLLSAWGKSWLDCMFGDIAWLHISLTVLHTMKIQLLWSGSWDFILLTKFCNGVFLEWIFFDDWCLKEVLEEFIGMLLKTLGNEISLVQLILYIGTTNPEHMFDWRDWKSSLSTIILQIRDKGIKRTFEKILWEGNTWLLVDDLLHSSFTP